MNGWLELVCLNGAHVLFGAPGNDANHGCQSSDDLVRCVCECEVYNMRFLEHVRAKDSIFVLDAPVKPPAHVK